MRSEKEIFDELAKLSVSPGYVHAIAFLCYENTAVPFEEEFNANAIRDALENNKSNLVRNEISTLIGLLIKEKIDYQLPSQEEIGGYLNKTVCLLQELHNSFVAPAIHSSSDEMKNSFTMGSFLREPIFYGGESAYTFQYLDFSVKKYKNDNAWLERNKGFSIEIARDIVQAIIDFQNKKVFSAFKGLNNLNPDDWTMLPGYMFSKDDIAKESGIDVITVEKVLQAFSIPDNERNAKFNSISDYNVTNSSPLIDYDRNTFILFQTYSIVEALYESPFFWMNDDKSYASKALSNRGKFTEKFAHDKLIQVFGKERVFLNVRINEFKGKEFGEIDVLVIFGSRIIVLQAKSKRLTIESRKGNDNTLREDFKKSIEESYIQASQCAIAIGKKNLRFTVNSIEIQIPKDIKEIYIFCVVADHYPSLAFQARQFLEYKQTDIIFPPFISDVFLLDVMAEMLHSPLYFLSYINRRVFYAERLMASNELIILSYHLQRNLWFEDNVNMICFDHGYIHELDAAMAVRRLDAPGKESVDGILTRFSNTFFQKILDEIENKEESVDLGFMLLTLNEETIKQINSGIEQMINRSLSDRKNQDLTIGLEKSGLTIHCNNFLDEIAFINLKEHCQKRKKMSKVDQWFGICIFPEISTLKLRFILCLEYKFQ